MFSVKAEILKELFKDEEWVRRLEACKSTSDVQRVLREFCKAKGYKTAQIEETA
jgi:hypothetical protein